MEVVLWQKQLRWKLHDLNASADRMHIDGRVEGLIEVANLEGEAGAAAVDGEGDGALLFVEVDLNDAAALNRSNIDDAYLLKLSQGRVAVAASVVDVEIGR